MAPRLQAFRYKIMELYLNDSSEPINNNYVKYIMIENLYEAKTSGAIYISMSVPASLYRKILNWENTTKGYIILALRPENVYSPTSVHENYVEGKFMYTIPTSNPDYSIDLEPQNKVETNYKDITISLINNNSLDKLKTSFGGIYWKTSMAELVKRALVGFDKVVVQPIEDFKLPMILIPFINNRKKYLEYLFDLYPFYQTSYTFFADFKKVYLVANDTDSVSSNGIDTVVFNINSVVDPSSYYEGISAPSKKTKKVDTNKLKNVDYIDNSAYNIFVNPANIAVIPNKGVDKITNTIGFVNESGVFSFGGRLKYGMKGGDDSSPENLKLAIRRCNETNMKVFTNMANSNRIYIELEKPYINGDFITPDKVIYIKFNVTGHQDFEDYNGAYYIVFKREIIRNNSGTFATSCSLGLRKIDITETANLSDINFNTLESIGATVFKSYKNSAQESKKNFDKGNANQQRTTATVTPTVTGSPNSNLKSVQKAGIDLSEKDPFKKYTENGLVTGIEYNPKLYDMSNCGPTNMVHTHQPESGFTHK